MNKKVHVNLKEFAKVGVGVGLVWGIVVWFFSILGFSITGSNPVISLLGSGALGLVVLSAVAFVTMVYLVVGAWISSYLGWWKHTAFWRIFQAYIIPSLAWGLFAGILAGTLALWSFVVLLIGALIASAITGLVGRFMAERLRLHV